MKQDQGTAATETVILSYSKKDAKADRLDMTCYTVILYILRQKSLNVNPKIQVVLIQPFWAFAHFTQILCRKENADKHYKARGKPD